MKRFLFYDTETTGVPMDYKAPSSDLENWNCRLVQLSWLLMDERQVLLSQGDLIIRPEGFTIPETASAIHGISTERALAEGVGCKEAVYYFLGAARMADYLVGHNESYDHHVVGAEMIRAFGKDYIEHLPSIDTMTSAIDLCKLPGRYGSYKFPKLMELHEKLFGCKFEDAHNSFADITATTKCFWEMVRIGHIKLDL